MSFQVELFPYQPWVPKVSLLHKRPEVLVTSDMAGPRMSLLALSVRQVYTAAWKSLSAYVPGFLMIQSNFLLRFLLEYISVFFFWGYCNNVLQTGQLKHQKFIILQFWRLQVQNQVLAEYTSHLLVIPPSNSQIAQFWVSCLVL